MGAGGKAVRPVLDWAPAVVSLFLALVSLFFELALAYKASLDQRLGSPFAWPLPYSVSGTPASWTVQVAFGLVEEAWGSP